MQHQDRTRHNCPTDECLRCSPVDAYKVAETKPDNCWLEISGSGRQVAPAGLHVIKGGEAGESVPGQSGCDRGAASPLWPDTSDRWLTAGGPCLAVRSPLDLWYHLLAVYINPVWFTSPGNPRIATDSHLSHNPGHPDNADDDWQLTGGPTINAYTVFKIKSIPFTGLFIYMDLCTNMFQNEKV